MPIARPGQPWSGTNYNGFSGAAPQDVGLRAPPPPPPLQPRRSPPKGVLLGGGIAVALAGGLFVGMLMRPDGDSLRDTPKAQAAAEAAAPAMAVEVARAAQPSAPVSAGKLEVLPPDMARDAETRTTVRPAPEPPLPTVARAAPRAPVGMVAPAAAAAPEPPAALQPREPRPAPVLAEPRIRPSYNCRFARTPAEQMICGDARLAQLDQRLDLAFRRAVSAGAPFRELRADQDDWLDVREDAAREGPRAVASIYRQRIAELDEMSRLGN